MSGLEVIGAIASIVQVIDVGIGTSQVIMGLCDTVKSGLQKTESRLHNVKEVQRLLTELRSEKEWHALSSETLIRSMVDKLIGLEKILRKQQQTRTLKFGKCLGLVKDSVYEKKIREGFDELERDKSTLLMHFAMLNLRSQQGIQCKLSKMPIPAGTYLPATVNANEAETVLSNLPATHVPHFIGQTSQLSAINAAVEATDDTERILVVTGTAGSGKSQLAINFGHARNKKRISIYWIDSSSYEQLKRSFWIIASELHSKKLCHYACADPEHSMDYVKVFLAATKTPWIVIFDNWDQPGVLPDLFSLIPRSNRGFVLVTSRHPEMARLGAASIELKGMIEDDALELLFTGIGPDRQPTLRLDGLAIVKRLGYLPLAIDQAASYIRNMGIPMQHFLQYYEKQMQQVLKHVPAVWEYRRPIQGKEDLESAGVFTTWELTFVSFAAKCSPAAQFMDMLGFFDRSSIDEAVFQNFVNSYKGDACIPDHLPATKAVYEVLQQFRGADGSWNSGAFSDVLRLLKNERLVEGSLLSSMGTLKISLHPLVSDWLKIRQDKQNSSRLFAQTCTVVQCTIHTKKIEADCSLEFWQELLAHVDNLLLHWNTLTMIVEEELHAALLTFCKFYFRRGRYTSAVDNYRKLLISLDSAGKQDSPQKYEALRGLARSLHTLGKYDEAERAVRESIDGFQKCAGAYSLQTAASKERLANLLKSRADYDGAEKIYLEVIACKKAAFGELDTRTLVSIANLGLVYKSQKKLDEAQVVYDQLATSLWNGGKEIEFSLVWIKSDYATLLQSKGCFKEAQIIYQEVLECRKKYLGHYHHDTLWTLADLATNLKTQQKYIEAKGIYEETVFRLKDQFGENHSETLWAASGLGDLYAQMGDLGQAEDMLVWVLQRRRKLLGNDHPNTLQTLDHLANVYSLQSRLEKPRTSTKKMTLDMQYGDTEPDRLQGENAGRGTAMATGVSKLTRSLAFSRYCRCFRSVLAVKDPLNDNRTTASIGTKRQRATRVSER